MRKIRVLVVDDSTVVRRLVSEIVSADPAFEIAGTASNGRLALEKLPLLHPDVVTLDIEMPELGGLETLREIRRIEPRLPVIMLSSLTERGAAATLESLFRGANDYVTKPSGTADLVRGVEALAEALLPRLRIFGARRVETAPPIPRSPAAGTPAPAAGAGRIEVVVIGASTGGPNALTDLLSSVASDLPVPVLIVQHMPPLFTRAFAQRLDSMRGLRVKEAEDGESVREGMGRVAPGDRHLRVAKARGQIRLDLTGEPPENSCRPSVDVLFRSAAVAFGSGVLGVVLTGMGRDGLQGCSRIRSAGGQVLAQDEASSVVWGMPGAVAQAGLAEALMAPRELGEEIVRRVREGRPVPAGGAKR